MGHRQQEELGMFQLDMQSLELSAVVTFSDAVAPTEEHGFTYNTHFLLVISKISILIYLLRWVIVNCTCDQPRVASKSFLKED